MAPNPSHLEFVDPVVEGMARAAGTAVDKGGAAQFDSGRTLPLLLHGDAAFPGQGIVAETLNLSRLEGYDTGGTIHIICNNQLGFTATSKESYGLSYSSGMARGFKIPIIHVNADDPIACIEAARRGDRVSRAVPPRFPDRPDRLSPSRPQRRRRTGVHAAEDVRKDRRASDGAQDLGDARSPRRARSSRRPPTRCCSVISR